jgi:hypothetical protein
MVTESRRGSPCIDLRKAEICAKRLPIPRIETRGFPGPGDKERECA